MSTTDTKVCKKCGISQPVSEFQKERRVKSGRQASCRTCKKEYARKRIKNPVAREKARKNGRESYQRNRDKQAADTARYYRENRDKLLSRNKARNRERYLEDEAHRLKIKDKNRQWAIKNRERVTALGREKQLRKARATPSWLSPIQQAQIQEFYDVAIAKSIQTGMNYQVDHIVALKGKAWRGLHVPWNLRVITAVDNNRKLNNPPHEMRQLFWSAA